MTACGYKWHQHTYAKNSFTSTISYVLLSPTVYSKWGIGPIFIYFHFEKDGVGLKSQK